MGRYWRAKLQERRHQPLGVLWAWSYENVQVSGGPHITMGCERVCANPTYSTPADKSSATKSSKSWLKSAGAMTTFRSAAYRLKSRPGISDLEYDGHG